MHTQKSNRKTRECYFLEVKGRSGFRVELNWLNPAEISNQALLCVFNVPVTGESIFFSRNEDYRQVGMA